MLLVARLVAAAVDYDITRVGRSPTLLCFTGMLNLVKAESCVNINQVAKSDLLQCVLLQQVVTSLRRYDV